MEYFLEKVGIIDFKYEKLRDKDRFNIFDILLDKTDEINLHSKFIYELLNNKGSHNLDNVFAKHFLQIIGISNFDLEHYCVYREYRNIDILITSDTKAIIIENKINANDQDHQLERYIKCITEEGFQELFVVYLTLDGRNPPANSIGKCKDTHEVILISYKYHITKWIDECTKSAVQIPQLRETLIQYMKLVNELTGNTMEQEQQSEIIELISKGDNVIKAQKIVESWIHIKWHTEFNFWTDFEKEVGKHYIILDSHKYSADKLDNVIHQTRKRNFNYGIMFKIADFKKCNVNIYIERGYEDMYYGITIDKLGNREVSDEKFFNQFAEKIEPFCYWGREPRWLGGNYIVPEINFELFNTENTIKLINQEYRTQYIREAWQQIEKFISTCKSQLSCC